MRAANLAQNNYDPRYSVYPPKSKIRQLEDSHMKEASKNLSSRLKAEHPGIAWREIAGMRDKVIHRYFEINWQIVWSVITDDLSALEPEFSALLKEMDERKQ